MVCNALLGPLAGTWSCYSLAVAAGLLCVAVWLFLIWLASRLP